MEPKYQISPKSSRELHVWKSPEKRIGQASDTYYTRPYGLKQALLGFTRVDLILRGTCGFCYPTFCWRVNRLCTLTRSPTSGTEHPSQGLHYFSFTNPPKSESDTHILPFHFTPYLIKLCRIFVITKSVKLVWYVSLAVFDVKCLSLPFTLDFSAIDDSCYSKHNHVSIWESCLY